MGGGADGLLAGGVAVCGVGLLGGGVDLEVEAAGSLLGESTFLTSSWPVGVDLRVLVIVHTTSAPSATDTLSGPASEPLRQHRAGAAFVLADDR